MPHFQVSLNTDHRLTAEQLFVPDERKEETGCKKKKKREIREVRRMKMKAKQEKLKNEREHAATLDILKPRNVIQAQQCDFKVQ